MHFKLNIDFSYFLDKSFPNDDCFGFKIAFQCFLTHLPADT